MKLIDVKPEMLFREFSDELWVMAKWPGLRTVIHEDEHERSTTTFQLSFEDERGNGYSFPCDSIGYVNCGALNPCARQNLQTAMSREDWALIVIRPWTFTERLCGCGSRLPAWREFDAQGIYLCSVCIRCREKKLAGYRPEILTGYTQADLDEPIEPEVEA